MCTKEFTRRVFAYIRGVEDDHELTPIERLIGIAVSRFFNEDQGGMAYPAAKTTRRHRRGIGGHGAARGAPAGGARSLQGGLGQTGARSPAPLFPAREGQENHHPGEGFKTFKSAS
jgi:hypothetical protein